MTEIVLTTTTDKLMAALDKLGGSVEEPRFTDWYGITYTGAPAHVVLAAFERPDITTLDGFGDKLRTTVREITALLGFWFNNADTPEEHVRVFAGLPAVRVCRVLAYLLNHGIRPVLNYVTRSGLPMLTEHLLEIADLDEDPTRGSFPTMPPIGSEWPGDRRPFAVTARAADGEDYVTVHARVDASETISWRFRTGVEVPVGLVHDVLTGRDTLGTYLEQNRDVIEDHLRYEDSQLDEGLYVTAELMDGPPPAGKRDDERPVRLYYIGTDRENAATGDPFVDRAEAEAALRGLDGYRVFTTTVRVRPSSLAE